MAIGLLAIFSGLVGMLIGGLVAVTGTALDVLAAPGQNSLEAMGGYALIVAGLIVMIAGLLQVVFGVGIWKLSAWAWILGVFIQSLSLISAALGIFTGAAIPASLLTIAVSGTMLTFLLLPRVRKAFGRGSRATIPLSDASRALQYNDVYPGHSVSAAPDKHTNRVRASGR
jgi:hypothetical protein